MPVEEIPQQEEEEDSYDVDLADRPIDIDPSSWKLDEQLSDHFTSNTVSAKWNRDVADWGPWSWEPDNAFVEDGALNLRMRYEEHSTRGMELFYKSGIIRSLDTISYGYVEARIKGIPIYPSASPAFWLYSLGSELDAWGLRGIEEGDVRYTEIDVVELTQGNWNPETRLRFDPEVMDLNLHTAIVENGQTVRKFPGEFPEMLKTEFRAPWDPRDAYHTYGAHISKDKITFYIDGFKISEKENLYWHFPMHVTLSLGLRYPHVTYNNCPDGLRRCPVSDAATQDGFPSQTKVDWVRCYRKIL